MNSIQYTIRSVPPKVDKTLRQYSKETGKSLNEVVVAALEKATGANQTPMFDDLDWFVGSNALPDSFDSDLAWLDSAPKDL